jgi:energy-coupling factor transporter ATP-binding protein EcfA2
VSRYSIAVKDFRIIKQAKVEPEGITLIYGPNGNGKSTLGKALVALLSNQHSEDNFRHGQSSYAIAVRAGDNRLVYTRNGGVSTLKFNDEGARQKLGRSPMSQVEPRFTLKRYDYEDDSFYPNFSFQNAVPIFGDISIYSLFSSMFSSIGRVSERVTACQSDCRAFSKKRADSLANSEMLKVKVSESTAVLEDLKSRHPDIDSEYREIKKLVTVKQEIDEFMQEFLSLENLCGNKAKRDMAALYDDAQPLFPAVMLVEKVDRVMSQVRSLEEDLEEVTGELSEIDGFLGASAKVDFFRLLSLGGKLQSLGNECLEIVYEMREVPEVSGTLFEGVGRLRRLGQDFTDVQDKTPPSVDVSLFQNMASVFKGDQVLLVLWEEFNSSVITENEVRGQLKSLPCERLAEGLCPYADKIKA